MDPSYTMTVAGPTASGSTFLAWRIAASAVAPVNLELPFVALGEPLQYFGYISPE